MSESRFVARPSLARLALFFVLALAFVAGGAWVAGLFGPAPRPGREWVGWIAMAFFGLGAIVILGRFFDGNDQIVVDDRGLYWRQWSTDLIPWSQIVDVREASVRNQRFLCIHLRDPERYSAMTLLGKLGMSSKAMGFGDIAINAVGTDKSFDALKDAVLAHWSGGRG